MKRPNIKRIRQGFSISLDEAVKRQLSIRVPAQDVLDLVKWIEHLENEEAKKTSR